MSPTCLAKITPLDRLMAIRDRFATGGSTGRFAAVLAAIAALFLVMVLIAWLIQRRRQKRVYNPKALFQDVLRQLPLTVPQRDLLRRLARDLRLEHPTVLLLSPQLFLESANAWMELARRANPATRAQLDDLARAIFAESTASPVAA